ncbi:hypothetical protein Pan216_31200 [Planctomycetes bacterium Pan216]|uniref:PilZ domain-containing protein n=1 Tax=Kolteria novifilia TaxID=2527975 RepID=A0A518B5J4_9BACT|nr:hypothetical protein Pan216_31200 [Planctomycetes bacterium Pan216]
MILTDYFSVSVSRLPIGHRTHQPIVDEAGQAMLVAGSEITSDFVNGLVASRIERVYVHRIDRESWGYASAADRAKNLRGSENLPRRFDMRRSRLQPPPQAMIDLARASLASPRGSADPEKRHEMRSTIAVPVPVIPLSDRHVALDVPTIAILRDISTAGASLLHSRISRGKYYVVEVDSPGGESVQLLLEVLRCQLVGRFYDIGGRLVAKLS